MAFIEKTCVAQDPFGAYIRLVMTIEQDLQQLGSLIARDIGEQQGMRRIGACECGADGVGVLHRKIDDAGNGSLRIVRRRRDGQCGLAQPARQHFVTTAVGMQRRFQRKALLGTPASMFMNKIETSNTAATQQSHDFVHMFSTVTGELGQKIGISGLGKFWYLGKYRLLELRRDGSGMVGNPVNGCGQDRTARDAPESVVERVDVVVGHGSIVENLQSDGTQTG
ncbi:MAG TPA: hypothetical protein VN325_42200 [Steroidobacteraceae bacterium]|nr:hypothetical protein [Steroidobacteraceae bacterium]